MESVDIVKPRSLLGMESQLHGCCRWFLMVVLLFWLCCVPSDCLEPSNKDRNSLWPIIDALQPVNERSSLSIATDSLKPNGNDGSTVWELPITAEPACDQSTRECRGGGSIITDEAIVGDNPRGVSRKGTDTEEEKQAVVLCKVKCFRADPVCGDDAITYWCGAPEAKCAGVEVAYKGYCDSRSGGAGKDGSRAAQSLFLVHLIWLVFAGFLVIADLL